MRPTRPDDLHPTALRAFLALWETGSFSLAAERLALTQPAISKRIQSLERTLGQPLFERLGRRVEALPAARLLEPAARDVLARLADVAHALDRLANGEAGTLRVAVSHHIALHHLPAVLRRLRVDAPDLHPVFQFLESEAAIAALDQRLADLALVTLPDAVADVYEAGVWTTENLVLAGRIDVAEPWTSRPWVLPPVGSTTLARIERALAPETLPNAHTRAPSIALIRNLIEHLPGIGFLPEDLIRPPLVAVGPPHWRVTRDLGWLRIRQRPRSALEARFIALLGANAASAT